MRSNPTEAEAIMWRVLRDRRLAGYKFRRQVPIGPFIADFVCYQARLIIELDGSQHTGSLYDAARDAELRRRGFDILRVYNSELFANREGVLDAVWVRVGGEGV
ncbi:endonuclease domain-containing protein [Arsenicitalea aurantiaca]|uniref:Endonuclease domain-containing protein n=2 Tax=Arsenicitalea aurantiaca TaxID=1783274 RepID=A0A433XBI0_9HYPH|nr:endonuclease domain-containing protein [Arsenicitalea aurantiaca]